MNMTFGYQASGISMKDLKLHIIFVGVNCGNRPFLGHDPDWFIKAVQIFWEGPDALQACGA
jgi:hypothetical protein